jgi:hypothetical protein
VYSIIIIFIFLSFKISNVKRSLVKQTYQDGELIIRQGDIGEHFYIVYEGSVLVTKTGDDGVEINQFELKKDNIFGERALIRKEPRARNIRAVGNVECLMLGSSEFSSMLGNVVEEMNSLNEFRILRELDIFRNVNDPKLKYLRKQFTVTTMVGYIYILIIYFTYYLLIYELIYIFIFILLHNC